MKIDIAVHGRFHAFNLANQLHRRGALGRLYTTYPEFAAKKFMPPNAAVKCFPHFEAWRRLSSRLGLARSLSAGLPRRFGGAVAKHLVHSSSDILVGWSSATLESIPVARDLGMKVVIERGSTHIVHQTEVLRVAYDEIGQPFTDTPQEIVDREMREYDLADAIAVPSTIAAESFIRRGIPEEKLIVSRLGVDLDAFRPDPESAGRAERPRILCVGAVGVRKGAETLIRAVDKLRGAAELHLVGVVEDGFRALLDRLPLEHVVLAGAVPHHALVETYRGADIFCLPSVEEGFGMVVLEAMASGLPVVVSDQVGARDAISGKAGIVVPVADVDALAEALRTIVEDPQKRREMGERARQAAVGGANGWEDYVDRLWPAYLALAGGA